MSGARTLPPCRHDPLDLPPVGEPYTTDFCRLCWLHALRHGRLENGVCRHLGQPTGDMVNCPDCPRGRRFKLHQCSVHGTCVLWDRVGNVHGCRGCSDFQGDESVPVQEINNGLGAGLNFNASAIRHKGRLVLAYRHGWSGARIRLAVLNDHWQPLRVLEPSWRVDKVDKRGQEDCRLFDWRGHLHAAYTCYDGRATSMGVVRFRDDLSFEHAWVPKLDNRRSWEKNWGFFQWAGQLFAVYVIRPHIVVLLDNDRADRVYETANSIHWPWGEMRGGASPVLHNGEFYSFFHSKANHDRGHYALGCYCFENKPPFRITRATRRPLIAPTRAEQPEKHKPVCIYPGGALVEGDDWMVICGWMDSTIRRYAFSRSRIERELQPI